MLQFFQNFSIFFWNLVSQISRNCNYHLRRFDSPSWKKNQIFYQTFGISRSLTSLVSFYDGVGFCERKGLLVIKVVVNFDDLKSIFIIILFSSTELLQYGDVPWETRPTSAKCKVEEIARRGWKFVFSRTCQVETWKCQPFSTWTIIFLHGSTHGLNFTFFISLMKIYTCSKL